MVQLLLSELNVSFTFVVAGLDSQNIDFTHAAISWAN